ncbi:MAG: hypothetical protein K9W44_01120 [Candidatus Lokiarchaeota archaeon]|nr:hypothetical protein [Candidatus Harpocratesius repetitus]
MSLTTSIDIKEMIAQMSNMLVKLNNNFEQLIMKGDISVNRKQLPSSTLSTTVGTLRSTPHFRLPPRIAPKPINVQSSKRAILDELNALFELRRISAEN